MANHPDRVTEAQAMLLQPLLRAVVAHMPPAGLDALRAEVAALRDRCARRGTPEGAALAEACDMALADLSPGMRYQRRAGG